MPVRVAGAKAERAAAACRDEFARAKGRLKAMELNGAVCDVDMSEEQRALVDEVLGTCARLVRGERPAQTLEDLAQLTELHRGLGSLSDVATANPTMIPALQESGRGYLAGFLAKCGGDPSVVHGVDGVVGPLPAFVGTTGKGPADDTAASPTPTFSEAAAEYAVFRQNEGTKKKELGALARHTAAFTELCGDRPLDRYSRRDLEDFAAELAFLPLRYGSVPGLKGASLSEAIAYGREHPNCPRISPGTVKDKYLADVRATIRRAAHRAEIPNPVEGAKLPSSKGRAQETEYVPLPMGVVNRAIADGVGSGSLLRSLLVPLLFLTTRRVGQACLIQRDWIRRLDVKGRQVVMLHPTETITTPDGRTITVPRKRGERLSRFVLHSSLVDLGLVDWIEQEGALFPALMHYPNPPARPRLADHRKAARKRGRRRPW